VPDEQAGGPAAGHLEVDTSRLTTVLDRLVDQGVLDREIAEYLGASLVIGATLLFLNEEWSTVGRVGRVGILAVWAAIMFAGGIAVRRRVTPPGHRWWRPWAGDGVPRRLASTLMTGAAVAAGFAAYAGFDATPRGRSRCRTGRRSWDWSW
jgi:hypothetical protein